MIAPIEATPVKGFEAQMGFSIGPSSKKAKKKVVSAYHRAKIQQTYQLAKIRETQCLELKKALIEDYLSSEHVKFTALVKANRALPWGKRVSLADCRGLSKRLSVFDVLDERVERRSIKNYALGPIPDGDIVVKPRLVYNFPLMNRAKSLIIRNLASVDFKPQHFQYEWNGKGILGLSRGILSAIDEGWCYCAHLDIKDHYGSFSQEGLKEILPLIPEQVVENTVTTTGYRVGKKEGGLISLSLPFYDIAPNPSGLPMGGPHSPVIAALPVSQADWSYYSGFKLFNYADNFILLAKNEHDLTAAIERLKAVVHGLPGGNFSLKLVQKDHISKPWYLIGRVYKMKDGKAYAEPDPKNEHVVWMKAGKYVDELDHILSSGHCLPAPKNGLRRARKIYVELIRYISSWLHAFKDCSKNENSVMSHVVDSILCTVLNDYSHYDFPSLEEIGSINTLRSYSLF